MRCCRDLRDIQYAYAFCSEPGRAHSVDPYDDRGDCYRHRCDDGVEHLHHNAAIGDLTSLEVWHCCNQEDAAVEAKSKATEAPYILQSARGLSDRCRTDRHDHNMLPLQTYNLSQQHGQCSWARACMLAGQHGSMLDRWSVYAVSIASVPS